MGSLNDPIADLLTRVRNASQAQHRFLDVPHSKKKEAIIRILKEKGFIAHYLIKEEKRKGVMRIFLKYSENRKPVIHGLKRVSKSSLRQYVRCREIPYVFRGIGVAILFTPKGVLDGDGARRENVGGELVCLAW